MTDGKSVAISIYPVLEDMMRGDDITKESRLIEAINTTLLKHRGDVTRDELRQSLLSPNFIGYWASNGNAGISPYSMGVFEETPKANGIILDVDGFAFWNAEVPLEKAIKGLFMFAKRYIPRGFDINNCTSLYYQLENDGGSYSGNYSGLSGNGEAHMAKAGTLDATQEAMIINFYLEGLRKL